MTEPRLTSATRVSALIRLAEAAGGFGVVVSKGDPMSGQILIQALEKGSFAGFFEPLLGAAGQYQWQAAGPQTIDDTDEISRYLGKRQAIDPDLWVVELDVPVVSRFIVDQASSA